jgi:hypothetical protein
MGSVSIMELDFVRRKEKLPEFLMWPTTFVLAHGHPWTTCGYWALKMWKLKNGHFNFNKFNWFKLKSWYLVQLLENISMFGTTWMCESTFALAYLRKSEYRTNISDENCKLKCAINVCTWFQRLITKKKMQNINDFYINHTLKYFKYTRLIY